MSLDVLILGLIFTAAPTAIVDSVTGVPGLRPFELLEAGAELSIKPRGRVRIAYFASCVHETIRGGHLRVGVTASLVEDALVERVTGDCMMPGIGDGSAGAPAALVLRDSAAPTRSGTVRRIRTRMPVLVGEPGTVVDLARVDVPGHRRRLRLEAHTLSLAETGLPLESGATYRACTRGGCIEVWIDPGARVGAGPILERTIPVAR